MYQSKVYTVSIPSSGVALEEEHIAREVIARWNVEEGAKHGVAFLVTPNNCKDVTPDIFIFTIDNYVDEQKVEAAIAHVPYMPLPCCSAAITMTRIR